MTFTPWFEANRHELRTRYHATHEDPKGEGYAAWCETEYERERVEVSETVGRTTGDANA